MRTILGLDIGTNSIGHGIVKEVEGKLEGVIELGSRILPMDQGTISDFEKGGTIKTSTADRRGYRSVRRMLERVKLRRSRLHRILHSLNWLPEHYAQAIDFEKRVGQFFPDREVKLPSVYDDASKCYRFLFMDSFLEMCADFQRNHPELFEDGKRIPLDWTIYYLRKKALTQPILPQELAWILLQFNQKRGYYQLRGEEEEEQQGKREEYHKLTIVDVVAMGEKRKGKESFQVKFHNGWVHEIEVAQKPEWIGLEKEYVVTFTQLKDGTEKQSFRAPKPDDWTLIKKRTELQINQSGKTVGQYIYDTLLESPQTKIKGALVRTVERKFYKDELKEILNAQSQFHSVLTDREVYRRCVEELYPNNEGHRSLIETRDLSYLFVEDILFYQRPLKTKKHLIDRCPYEKRWKRNREGEPIEVGIQCIAKSNPYYQEFVLWQFLRNLRIYKREDNVNGRLQFDIDVTAQFLPDEETYAHLYDWMNDQNEIKQEKLLKAVLSKKEKPADYRWNFPEEKTYPGNRTRYEIMQRLRKISLEESSELFYDKYGMQLWHLIYSIDDKEEYETALNTFAAKNRVSNDFVEAFKKVKPFSKEYGAYSEKAIKRLLPLLRRGKYWQAEQIDPQTLSRIEYLLSGEDHESIKPIVREQVQKYGLERVEQFQGLPLHLACYVVYNRHSEGTDCQRWTSPDDIDLYLKNFRLHSLNNPIVEQVVTETLRVVRDLWKKYGSIDEIHIELGREMKNPKAQREQMSKQNQENENTNLRIRSILQELKNNPDIENLSPFSPSHQDRFKIYEEGVLKSDLTIEEDLFKMSKAPQLSSTEIKRYTLWLEQHYRSPYTGQMIPLSKLFTKDYEIEHVIPKERFYDDSLANKVICESAVNKLKDKMLGMEFIMQKGGSIVDLGFGNKVQILKPEDYEALLAHDYKYNRGKLDRLMAVDVPERFIQRQMNDTRYISRLLLSLLSNIVREEGEEEATAKNVIPCNGSITTKLKQDWGLNDVWNDLVAPRFERLNTIIGKPLFGEWINRDGKRYFQTTVPPELQKGFQKKRIDHRHHAMDALVIACANRNIINYLNNNNAKDGAARFDLKKKIFDRDSRLLLKPWATFTQDARKALEGIVVSFKGNLRVLTQTTNVIQKREQKSDGTTRRVLVSQEGSNLLAIRKPLHKETVSGLVKIQETKKVTLSKALEQWEMIADKELRAEAKRLVREYKYSHKLLVKYFKDRKNELDGRDISRVSIYEYVEYTASRKDLDISFNKEKIKSITDTAIQKILSNHLERCGNDSTIAFSPEGIKQMNDQIVELNDGKAHQPILKVRVYESKGLKFSVGNQGNKPSKFVESAKGTNLFFAIYQNEEGERSFETIPLNIVIERLKQGDTPVPPTNDKGNLLMYLSPNDLVYVPTLEEIESGAIPTIESLDLNRIYKVVSCTRGECYFVPNSIASPIVQTAELGANNKAEKSWDGIMIKSVCVKLQVNRIGQIVKIER